MQIVGTYSFKRGKEAIADKYPHLFDEIEDAIASIDAEKHRTKTSKEKTKKGKLLFSPVSLNQAMKDYLYPLGWQYHRENCEYATEFYTPDYQLYRARMPIEKTSRRPYREMDFLKEGLGVEVQFGKYSFMVYNVCAKMTIFSNIGHIDTGVEIVPVKAFASQMSSGVSYFEQFVWDLQARGEADIDIPVLILGIDSDIPSEDLGTDEGMGDEEADAEEESGTYIAESQLPLYDSGT